MYANDVEKWIFWCFNYPPFETKDSWIHELWDKDGLGDHFENKFSGLYTRCGCNAAMNKFYCELDDEHRAKLYKYAMDYMDKH